MIFCPKIQIYTVHVNPALPSAAEQAVFVREGFCWLAFIFGIAWTLYHRLWLVSALIAAAVIVLGEGEKQNLFTSSGFLILQFALSFFIGLNANDWRREALARRGYLTYDVVASDSDFHAKQRYFERLTLV